MVLSLGSVLLPTLLIPRRPLLFLGAIPKWEQGVMAPVFYGIKQTG